MAHLCQFSAVRDFGFKKINYRALILKHTLGIASIRDSRASAKMPCNGFSQNTPWKRGLVLLPMMTWFGTRDRPDDTTPTDCWPNDFQIFYDKRTSVKPSAFSQLSRADILGLLWLGHRTALYFVGMPDWKTSQQGCRPSFSSSLWGKRKSFIKDERQAQKRLIHKNQMSKAHTIDGWK